MLTPADRYSVPGRPNLRIAVDSGGAGLEEWTATGDEDSISEWVLVGAAVSLDELMHATQLAGLSRANLVPEGVR